MLGEEISAEGPIHYITVSVPLTLQSLTRIYH